MKNKPLFAIFLIVFIDLLGFGLILGLSSSIESLTRVIAPTLGGLLLNQLGYWSPGTFSALILGGLFVYVWITIYNHPMAATSPSH